MPSDDLGCHMEILVIRQVASDDLPPEDKTAFLRVGFSHHTEILNKCNLPDERWYYIRKCASEFWSYELSIPHRFEQ